MNQQTRSNQQDEGCADLTDQHRFDSRSPVRRVAVPARNTSMGETLDAIQAGITPKIRLTHKARVPKKIHS